MSDLPLDKEIELLELRHQYYKNEEFKNVWMALCDSPMLNETDVPDIILTSELYEKFQGVLNLVVEVLLYERPYYNVIYSTNFVPRNMIKTKWNRTMLKSHLKSIKSKVQGFRWELEYYFDMRDGHSLRYLEEDEHGWDFYEPFETILERFSEVEKYLSISNYITLRRWQYHNFFTIEFEDIGENGTSFQFFCTLDIYSYHVIYP